MNNCIRVDKYVYADVNNRDYLINDCGEEERREKKKKKEKKR